MFENKITTQSARKRTLGALLSSSPAFETLYPLLKRLKERGELELKIIASSELCRTEPRIPKLLSESQLPYRTLSKTSYRYFYWTCFRDMDALLDIADPAESLPPHRRRLIDPHRHQKKRNRYLVNLNLPIIFFQHGVVQTGLNCGFLGSMEVNPEQTDFYSTSIFLMEYPAKSQQKYFSESALERIEVSGFINKPCFPTKSPPSSITSKLSKYDVRLLICHSFRSSMVPKEQVQSFYSMIEQFANDNPKIGVIVRPHRGMKKRGYAAYERNLDKKCSNVHFMYFRYGPLKRMSMTDALSITDMMISTPSTAILDAVYMKKPAAVCMNNHIIFERLPQITDSASIKRFVIDAKYNQESAKQLIARYGNIDENIEQTCSKVEKIFKEIFA